MQVVNWFAIIDEHFRAVECTYGLMLSDLIDWWHVRDTEGANFSVSSWAGY